VFPSNLDRQGTTVRTHHGPTGTVVNEVFWKLRCVHLLFFRIRMCRR